MINEIYASRALWKIHYWFTSLLSLIKLYKSHPQFHSSSPSIHSISPSTRSSFSSSSFFLLPICFPLLRVIYTLHSLSLSLSPSFPLSLTGWAHYLLPAETAAQNLKPVRAYIHFLCATFYTVHYNARTCKHYTVSVIHYQPILRTLEKIRKL